MKRAFIEKKFRKASLARINQINGIIEEYDKQDYTLTIRQLFYQMVSRGIIKNKKNEYDNLVTLVSDARKAGLIDWSAIEDRTRYLRGYITYEDPAEIVRQTAWRYKTDLWKGQPCHIEVFVEKDALIDVVAKACSKYRVDFFSCRGYCSDTSLYHAGKRLRGYYDDGSQIIILHLGDHDPSGVDMSRDILDRLELYGDLSGKIDFQRIALNMDQIEELKPPPNFAKETDKRFRAYIDKYGSESWELDALEPAYIESLIHTKIEKYLDRDLFDKRLETEKVETEELIVLANKWDEVREVLHDQHI